MGITFNIIEHELKKLWPIQRSLDGNPSFDDARIYHDGELPASKGMLYICDDVESCEKASEDGHVVIYVCRESAPGLRDVIYDLRVLECPDKLAVLDALLDIFSKYRSWEAELNMC